MRSHVAGGVARQPLQHPSHVECGTHRLARPVQVIQPIVLSAHTSRGGPEDGLEQDHRYDRPPEGDEGQPPTACRHGFCDRSVVLLDLDYGAVTEADVVREDVSVRRARLPRCRAALRSAQHSIDVGRRALAAAGLREQLAIATPDPNRLHVLPAEQRSRALVEALEVTSANILRIQIENGQHRAVDGGRCVGFGLRPDPLDLEDGDGRRDNAYREERPTRKDKIELMCGFCHPAP